MMNVLIAALACLTQDPQFPLFEKDPWHGFLPGSTVTRDVSIPRQARYEETQTLKAIDATSKTLRIVRGEEAGEGPVPFTSFSAMLVGGTGNRVTGKSNRILSYGAAKVRALVREISPAGDLGGMPWRITTADEAPGGILEATWTAEGDETRFSLSYVCKGIEKIKIEEKDVTCARFELKATEKSKASKSIEGTYWLSSQVPGLLVRGRTKVTQGKTVTEMFVNVVRFEAAK